jgi:uncharacterized phage protein gp47/JayE
MPFSTPTLQQLNARAQADIAARLQGSNTALRWSPERVLATVSAGHAHSLHGHLAWLARQILPTTADTEIMEQWANFYGLFRKPATQASGVFNFRGADTTVLPADSSVQSNDGRVYKTQADATVVGSAGSVIVMAVVPGTVGNLDQGATLAMSNPVAGIQSTGTAGVAGPPAIGISNGFDVETDQQLLSRLLVRVRTPALGGGKGDYVAWALEVPGITRAWEYSWADGIDGLELGQILVHVIADGPGGPIPDDSLVATALAYITSKCPLTVELNVYAPTANYMNPNIVLHPNNSVTRPAVTAAINDMLLRTAVPGGSILASQLEGALSTVPGLTDWYINTPSGLFVCTTGQLALLGTPTYA